MRYMKLKSPLRKDITNTFIKVRFKHEQLNLVQAVIKRVHKTHGRKTRCTMITGLSHTGKSESVLSYVEKFKTIDCAEFTHPRILYISLSDHVTPKGLIKIMLRHLGIRKKSERASDLFDDLVEQLAKCGVELIVIDEIQHVLSHTGTTTTQGCADFFKAILNKANVPLVFVGTPKSVRLYDIHQTKRNKIDPLEKRDPEQLINRSIPGVELSTFSHNSHKWRMILNSFHQSLNMPCIKFSNDIMMKRWWLATNGILGRVSNVLEEALEIVEENKQINLTLLAEAYENTNNWNFYNSFGNPFDPKNKQLDKWLGNELELLELEDEQLGRLMSNA